MNTVLEKLSRRRAAAVTIAFTAGLLLLAAAAPRAIAGGFSRETGERFLAAGDFNGDGEPDAVVAEKATGLYRIGLGNAAGEIAWQPARSSGIDLLTDLDALTGLAAGTFLSAAADTIAVTAVRGNRVHLLPTQGPNAGQPQAAYLSAIGPSSLAALPIGGAGANPGWDDLFVGTGANGTNPWAATLLRNNTGGSFAEHTAAAAAAEFARANPLLPAPAGVDPLLSCMRRLGASSSFQVHDLAAGTIDPASPAAELTGLFYNAAYAYGFFGVAAPDVFVYGSGATTIDVYALASGPFAFGPKRTHNLFWGIIDVAVVGGTGGDPDRLLLQFNAGPVAAGLYDYDRVGVPALVQSFLLAPGQTGFSGLLPLPGGDFVLLSGGAQEIAERYDYNGNLVHSSTLTPLSDLAARANLLLFDKNPFTDETSRLLGSYQSGDWSSNLDFVSSFPFFTFDAESFAGEGAGLDNPAPGQLGPQPAGIGAGLASQYRGDISIFSLGSAVGLPGEHVTIDPSPGLYPSAISVSFDTASPSTTIYYRFGDFEPWQTLSPGASFWLFYNAEIQYYAKRLGSERKSTIQRAAYTFSDSQSLDSDGDKVPDYVEVAEGLDPTFGADSDLDGDSDFEELLNGTDPNDPLSNSGDAQGIRLDATFDLVVTPRPYDGLAVPPVETRSFPLAIGNSPTVTVTARSGDGTQLSAGETDDLINPLPSTGVPAAELTGVSKAEYEFFVTLATEPVFKGRPRVVSVTITDPGSGYGSTPGVVFSGGGLPQAAGVAVISGGTLESIDLTATGAGYVFAPTVTLSGGSPTVPATAVAVLDPAPNFGREMLALVPVPEENLPELSGFYSGSGDINVAAAQWISDAQLLYLPSPPDYLRDPQKVETRLDRDTTLIALFVEAIASQILDGKPNPQPGAAGNLAAPFSFFPHRENDAGRMPVSAAMLDYVPHPGLQPEPPAPALPAYRLEDLYQGVRTAVTAPLNANVQSLRDVVTCFYEAASKRDTSPAPAPPGQAVIDDFIADNLNPGDVPFFEMPVDAIRTFLDTGALPQAYQDELHLTNQQILDAITGCQDIIDSIPLRPVASFDLAAGYGPELYWCSQLQDPVTFDNYVLVDKHADLFPIPSNFLIQPDSRFKVIAYTDVNPADVDPFCFGAPLEVISLSLESVPIPSPVDADGNLLPDDWEELFFGASGQDAFSDPDGSGFTLFEQFVAGSDPLESSSVPGGAPLDLSLPNLRIETINARADLRFTWFWPGALAGEIEFLLASSPDLITFATDPAPAPVEVPAGSGNWELVIPNPGGWDRFFVITLRLPVPGP